jgi:hypothetical protein
VPKCVFLTVIFFLTLRDGICVIALIPKGSWLWLYGAKVL